MNTTKIDFFTPLPSFSGEWKLVEKLEAEAIRKEISKSIYREDFERGNSFPESVQNGPCVVRKVAINCVKIPTQIVEVLSQKSQRLAQSIVLIKTPQSLSVLNEDVSQIRSTFNVKALAHENGSLQEYMKVCLGCVPPQRLFLRQKNQSTHSCSSKFVTSEHSSYLLEGLEALKAHLLAYDQLDGHTKQSIEKVFRNANSKMQPCANKYDAIVLNSNKVWKVQISVDNCGQLTLLGSHLMAHVEHNLKQKTLHLGASKLIRKSDSSSPIKAFDWGKMFGFKLDQTQPLKSGGLN